MADPIGTSAPQSTVLSQAALTVSELTRDAKTLLESHFDQVRVEGEIGDFSPAASGHWYFTLKDNNAQIRCAMFKGANARVKQRPNRGDVVRIRARVSLYEARGEFQLIVQHLEPAGDGALQLAFERLKTKLQSEGLFDPANKKSLPAFPRRIGVVTSIAGAALHDVLSVLGRRSPMIEVVLLPVPVQGTDAPAAIAQAIKQANDLTSHGNLELDVLIVGRGGGSLEDLWAFNDEQVARAIANSLLPIISAVGHEVDFTIADFVADQRAATPSAAAELASFDQTEWLQRFDQAQTTLQSTVRRRLRSQRERLGHLRARLRHPGRQVEQQRRELNTLTRQLQHHALHRLRNQHQQLQHLAVRLQQRHPRLKLQSLAQTLSTQRQQLEQRMQNRVSEARRQLQEHCRLLNTLGPQQTLMRGYAIVQTASGTVVRDSAIIPTGELLSVKLSQGQLDVSVLASSSDTTAN